MAKCKSELVTNKVNELLYVRHGDGSYRGWKQSLLLEKVAKCEEKFLLCALCQGLLRDACLVEDNEKQEIRCSLCLPEDIELLGADINQESVDEKYVECPLKERGCKWTDLITQALSHLCECDFFLEECPLGCEKEEEIVQMERRFLEDHQKSHCPLRIISCEACDSQTKACETNAHIETCDEILVTCPNSCMGKDWVRKLKRKDVPAHLKEECPLQEVECPFYLYGCKDKLERTLMEKHQKDYCQMRLILCEFCKSQMRACEMNRHLDILCKEFLVICPNACMEEKECRKLKRKNLPSHLGEECPLQEVECPYAEYGCDEKMERRLVGQHEKESIHKHFRLTTVKIREQSDKIDYLEKRCDEKEREILRIGKIQKIDITKGKEMKSLIFSGSLKWKITKIDERIGNKEIMYSNPFYVCHYKLQVKIRWHCESPRWVGFFLYIMKGDWDDKLTWPFRYAMKFKLLDQYNETHDRVWSCKISEEIARKYPSCFGKPTGFRNNGYGFFSCNEIREERFSRYNSILLNILVEKI